MTTINQVGVGLSSATGTGNFVGSIQPTITTPTISGKILAPTSIASSTSLDALSFSYTASAVNRVVVGNSATGNPVFIGTAGSDSAIDLRLLTHNGNVTLIDGTNTSAPSFRFYNTVGSHYTGLKVAGAQATDVTFTIPATDGSANYLLKTDGSANLSFSNGSQIAGTATNDNASAGNIGEFISSNVGPGSPVSLITATPKNITSISLTAGDWSVTGFGTTVPALGTVTTSFIVTTSLVSDTLGGPSPFVGYAGFSSDTSSADAVFTLNFNPVRISLAATTTIYLVAQSIFSVSTQETYGWISARRVR